MDKALSDIQNLARHASKDNPWLEALDSYPKTLVYAQLLREIGHEVGSVEGNVNIAKLPNESWFAFSALRLANGCYVDTCGNIGLEAIFKSSPPSRMPDDLDHGLEIKKPSLGLDYYLSFPERAPGICEAMETARAFLQAQRLSEETPAIHRPGPGLRRI